MLPSIKNKKKHLLRKTTIQILFKYYSLKFFGVRGLFFWPWVHFTQRNFIDRRYGSLQHLSVLPTVHPRPLLPTVGPECAEGGVTAQAGVDEQDKGEEENGEIGGDCQGPILLRQEVQAQCLNTSTHMQSCGHLESGKQCCGSGMFMPDPGSEFFPSRIPDPPQEFKYFNPKKWFPSTQKYYPGFLPIPDPGSRGQKGIGSRIRMRNTADKSIRCG